VDIKGALMRNFLTQAPDYLQDKGHLFFSYSNLGNPTLLEYFVNTYSFNMITAEYIAKTGVIKAIYQATVKS
jgi:methylase of polypeptide subunit release factors